MVSGPGERYADLVLRLVLILLATFWAWETLRFAMESYLSRWFALSRPVHPLLVASLPLWVLWPDWVAALAVAGATGLLVAVVDRVFSAARTSPVVVPRPRRQGGLPPLP